jgi:hypothetical protein
MSHERLNDDQRLLYECLRDIWDRQSRNIILAICLAIALAVGVTVGVIRGTRTSRGRRRW